MAEQAQETLLGSKPGQMNLRGIRSRAMELMQTIHGLLQTLQFAPGTLRWNDVVDKFAVMNVQLQHLKEQLRPVTKHYVVHPKSVNQSNANKLPIMLATRRLPGQEEEVDRMLDQYKVNGKAGSHGIEIWEEWGRRLNTLCDELISGSLDSRGSRKRRGGKAQKRQRQPMEKGLRSDGSEKEASDDSSRKKLLRIVGFGGLPEDLSSSKMDV